MGRHWVEPAYGKAAANPQLEDRASSTVGPNSPPGTMSGGMGLAVGAKAYIRQQSPIIGRIDSRPHLAVPTWIVVGDRDAVTPPDRAQEMASAITGARLEIVEGAGHLTPLEQADAIERLLTEWLSD